MAEPPLKKLKVRFSSVNSFSRNYALRLETGQRPPVGNAPPGLVGFFFIEHCLSGTIVVAPETKNTDAPGAETPGLVIEVPGGTQCDASVAACAAFMVDGDVVPQAVKQFPEGRPLDEP